MIQTIQREGTLTLPSDREIVMTRVFNAPAKLLFDVWTKPEHVRKWYAVRSTTVTICDIDLRVGGKWRWVSAKSNGFEIAFSGTFLEIDPPHRIVRTERFEAVPGEGCLVTITFDESEGQTTQAIRMTFDTKEERDLCLQSGMELGVIECYQNIDALIAGISQ